MRSNNKVQLLLVALVLALGIGYAYINSDLNINGTAQVRSANWDVHWANIAVTTGSVTGSNVVTSPAIQNQTTVNYSVILNQPGDYYEFTVDAVNGGTIDAMIDTITSKLNGATITTLPAYLKYSVTYSDGAELEQNHQLLHNTTEKYKVRIEYNPDINTNQLPASNQTLSLQFTVTYRQANENAEVVPHIVYTINNPDYDDQENTMVHIGQPIPSAITKYYSIDEIIDFFETETSGETYFDVYLKHIVKNGIVTASYVEFTLRPEIFGNVDGVTPGTYALRGFDTFEMNAPGECKSEYYDPSTYRCIHPYFESNRDIALTAYNKDLRCVDFGDTLSCNYYNGLTRYGMGISFDSNGGVNVDNSAGGGWQFICAIESNGRSYCHY